MLSTCDSMCLRSLLEGFQSKDVAKEEREEKACCFLEESSTACKVGLVEEVVLLKHVKGGKHKKKGQ